MARPTRRPKRPSNAPSGPDWHKGTERWLARPFQRIMARVLDGVIFALLWIAGILVFGRIGPPSRNVLCTALLVYGVVIEPLMVAYLGGSVGKLASGLRIIRRSDGRAPPGLWTALKRQLAPSIALTLLLWLADSVSASRGVGDVIDNAANLIIAVLSLWWIFTDRERRSVLDRIGGTIVVRVPKAGPPGRRRLVIPEWTGQ